MLEYRKKIRPLRVRTLDGSIKTVLVDDSNTVAELTKTVCSRIGKSSACVICVCTSTEVVMFVVTSAYTSMCYRHICTSYLQLCVCVCVCVCACVCVCVCVCVCAYVYAC